MNKYLLLFKTKLQSNIYYRINALIWTIFDLTPFIALIIVWRSVFASRTIVAGLNLSQMVSYYFLVSLVSELITTHEGETIAEEIYQGNIVFYLLKPISYLKRIFIKEIGWHFWLMILFLSLYIPLFFMLKNLITINLSWLNIIFFIIAIALAFFINGLLSYLGGIAGFWFTQTTTIFHLKLIMFWLLGGLAFPLELLPRFLQTINTYLPFAYVFSFPVAIITKNLSWQDLVFKFFMQIFWIILLFFIYKKLWRKGLKRYESFGN